MNLVYQSPEASLPPLRHTSISRGTLEFNWCPLELFRLLQLIIKVEGNGECKHPSGIEIYFISTAGLVQCWWIEGRGRDTATIPKRTLRLHLHCIKSKCENSLWPLPLCCEQHIKPSFVFAQCKWTFRSTLEKQNVSLSWFRFRSQREQIFIKHKRPGPFLILTRLPRYRT